MTNVCGNCGHNPDDHEGGGCIGWLETLWGGECCGCPRYEKDDSDD